MLPIKGEFTPLRNPEVINLKSNLKKMKMQSLSFIYKRIMSNLFRVTQWNRKSTTRMLEHQNRIHKSEIQRLRSNKVACKRAKTKMWPKNLSNMIKMIRLNNRILHFQTIIRNNPNKQTQISRTHKYPKMNLSRPNNKNQ